MRSAEPVRANGEQPFRTRSNRSRCGGCSPSLHSALGRKFMSVERNTARDPTVKVLAEAKRIAALSNCGDSMT